MRIRTRSLAHVPAMAVILLGLTFIAARSLGATLYTRNRDDFIFPFFNTAAFIPNPPGLWGAIGRGTLRGPMTWNLDIALSRRLQLGENKRIELRAEAFNVLNKFRPNDPNSTLNNVNFGRITSAQDPRIMQFALKYLF